VRLKSATSHENGLIMLPTDTEFISLYLIYALFYSWALYGINKTPKNRFKKILVLVVVLFLNLFLFIPKSNFQYGSSLAVLFYSFGLFLVQVGAFVLVARGRKV
jgi:hypothetical protein